MNKRKILNAVDRPDAWKKALSGKRVGLITNPSGVDRNLRLTFDIISKESDLVCLFSPEHGVRGDKQAGDHVESYTDEKTGLPVYSLFGGSKNIKPEILEGLDAVAFDIQDIGARFYTYMYTLSFAMEDCAKYKKEMIVFDRLNPLGGMSPQGTILEREFSSTIGRFPLATRFNMTIGEYAKYINDTENISCDLTVIPIEGWTRDCIFQDTDLIWVSPSPNIPTPDSSFCYIGTCLAEGTNLSEGRGTAHPFEMIGAPWLDPESVISYMRSLDLPGVKFRPCHFAPTFSKHSGELCHGVMLHITDHKAFLPFETGLYLFDHIRKNFEEFKILRPSAGGRSHLDLLMGCNDFNFDDFNISAFLEKQKKQLSEYEEKIKLYYMY